MELIAQFIDIILHLDAHLALLTERYGVWVYAILFVIIFAETGLVVTPFLPGDSLLFVAGTLAATGALDVNLLVGLLIIAAVLGDAVNFHIGAYLGPKVYSRPDSRFFRQAHLRKAHDFYEQHGGKTIIIARFIPIIRTYAPFVAGVAQMPYSRFLAFNLSGGALWVASLAYAGFFFGNLPIVQNNLSLVIIGIILLSISPGVIEYLRARQRRA